MHPFPAVIDNTMRSDYFDCKRKFFWSFIRQLGPLEPSADLHAGGAFAAGQEAIRNAFYRDGLSVSDSFKEGMTRTMEYWGEYEVPGHKEHKDLSRVLGALGYYYQVWPLGSDKLKPLVLQGKPSVEFSFAIPLPIDHPETGEPLIYAGRSDMIAEYGGSLYVEDDKTATQLGPTWPGKWDMRSQFTGYVYAARTIAQLPVAGVIVRGISFLKNGYGSAEAISSRPQWFIDLWYHQLLRDVTGMIQNWREGYWDYALNDACEAYGGCPFKKLCLTPNPESWIEGSYSTRIWNPLEKNPLAITPSQVPESGQLPEGVRS